MVLLYLRTEIQYQQLGERVVGNAVVLPMRSITGVYNFKKKIKKKIFQTLPSSTLRS